MKRPIKLLSSAICLSAFFLIPVAHAGFEWMPPTQSPAPTAQPSHYQAAPAQPSASAMYNSMGGFPAVRVDVEPLGAQNPTSIMPPQQWAPQLQPMRNLSGSGLRIDPYPLRNSGAQGKSMELSESSVRQAMAEESRLLNPLRLGVGLTTGVQPRPAIMPSVGNMPAPRAPYNSMGAPSGLTPMTGGEPAPLPGMAKSRVPMPMMNYAEAVGFGRDLPLALALSQIIPSEFTHSYAAGVDAGLTISWEGGKPWNEVLSNMLHPHNLTASIHGTRVIIQPMASL